MELGDVYAFGYNGFEQIIQQSNKRILVTPVKWEILTPKHQNSPGFTSLEPEGQQTSERNVPENSPATFRGETAGGSSVRATPPVDDHSGGFSFNDTGAHDQLQMKWHASICSLCCSSAGFIMGCLNGEKGKFNDLSTYLDDVTPSPRKLCLHEDKFYIIDDQGECYVRDCTGNTATKVNKVILECAPSSNEVLQTRGRQATKREQGSKMEERCKPLLEELPASVDGNLQEVSNSSVGKRTEEHPFARFMNIYSGDSHVLATVGPENRLGQITRHEDGAYIFHPFLQPVEVQEISCGKEHALLLTAQGLVYSYGMGSRGQLGHGRIGRVEDEPKLVEAIACVPMVTVSAGGWHSACVSAIGDLYVWGWNESGQLGLSPYSDSTGLHGEQEDETQAACQVTFQVAPAIIDLPGGVNVSKVSCGTRHTAAVTYDKRLYTWGWGKYGQLGHGDVQSCEAPKQVDFFIQNRLDVLDVTCGDWSTAVSTRPSPKPWPR